MDMDWTGGSSPSNFRLLGRTHRQSLSVSRFECGYQHMNPTGIREFDNRNRMFKLPLFVRSVALVLA